MFVNTVIFLKYKCKLR